jgi:tetratricopeptide (TPR) repeat protein
MHARMQMTGVLQRFSRSWVLFFFAYSLAGSNRAGFSLAGFSLAGFSPAGFSPAAQQADPATIRRYSQQAEDALAAKNVNAAVLALEKLARLTPDNPEVYANLGAAYYTQGRFAQAAEAFERALHLNPKISNVPLMLGMCDAELGRLQEAVTVLEPAFRHPPDNEMGRAIGLKLASVYSDLGQHRKALEVTEQLLERYSNDPEILYRASHFYGDRALETMTRLAQVAPESPWKRMAFAEALEGEKRYDLAVIEYRKVIEADPGMSGVHYRLARALLLKSPDNEGARDEALKEFQAALRQDPRNAAAEYEIGEICRRRGQAERALEHFSRAVEIGPGVEEAQIALARTLIGLDKPEESLAHLRAAIRLNSKNEVSHFLLAEAYKSLGDSTDYQNEMALFRKYHVRPYADESAGGDQLPPALTTPEVTKQTLDLGSPSQP